MRLLIEIMLLAAMLQGCQLFSEEVKTNLDETEVIETEQNTLFELTAEYSDVHDIGIPKKTGQSQIIRLSKDEFSNITENELSEYLAETQECKLHDWHALVIGEDTCILETYNSNEIIYGIWDENDGMIDAFGYYEEKDNRIYEYRDISNE